MNYIEKNDKSDLNVQEKREYILNFDDYEYKINIDLIEKIVLLREYIEKNSSIDRIEFNKLINTLKTKKKYVEFILNYASLYPTNKEEYIIPEYKYVSRNIDNLLNIDEYQLFNKLLNDLEIKEKIHILSKLYELCAELKMEILSDKIANIIAIHIKDKPIHLIESYFN